MASVAQATRSHRAGWIPAKTMNNITIVKMSPTERVAEIESMPSGFGVICRNFGSTPAILMANPATGKAVDGYCVVSLLE
jgi:hypothetical protein